MKKLLFALMMLLSLVGYSQKLIAKDTMVAGMKWTCVIKEDFPGQIKSVSVGSRELVKNTTLNSFEYKRTASASGKSEKGVYRNRVTFWIEYNDEVEKPNTIVKEYKVRRPRLVVKAGKETDMYGLKLNQENELFITCPDINPLYRPAFRISSGQGVITGTDGKGRLVVIPRTPGKITIRVASGGKIIGSQVFKVE